MSDVSDEDPREDVTKMRKTVGPVEFKLKFANTAAASCFVTLATEEALLWQTNRGTRFSV